MNSLLTSTKPDMAKIPGGYEPDTQHITLRVKEKVYPTFNLITASTGSAEFVVVNNLFSNAECNQLIELFDSAPTLEEVSIQGLKFTSEDKECNLNMGSKRSTMWCPDLAQKIWDTKLKGVLKPIFPIPTTPTDWFVHQKDVANFEVWSSQEWHAMLCSPMMRFMKYKSGGQHYAHYDAGYVYPFENEPTNITLYSYVLYLSDSDETVGGATRFIDDQKMNVNCWEKDYCDWDREVKPEEVLASVYPKKGSMLLFPHRLCHDVEAYFGSHDRIIVRGDVVFERRPS